MLTVSLNYKEKKEKQEDTMDKAVITEGPGDNSKLWNLVRLVNYDVIIRSMLRVYRALLQGLSFILYTNI